VLLEKLLELQKIDFKKMLHKLGGLPMNVRLLDPPFHEFLPKTEKDIQKLAVLLEKCPKEIESRIKELKEENPMLGHRGCRLAVTYPEIARMQTRAVIEAAINVNKEGLNVTPEIMIPLVGDVKELPSHYHATNIVPTQFTGTLSFYLRSYKEVLDLSSTVLLVGTKGDKLGFNIKYGEITFAVSIELETQLNMPEPPKEAEASEVYVVTVNLTINGYSSVAKEFPVPIILEVNEALKT
jgi:hypothetical protein